MQKYETSSHIITLLFIYFLPQMINVYINEPNNVDAKPINNLKIMTQKTDVMDRSTNAIKKYH